MATAPATPINSQRKMIEVKAPEMFKFTKQGQQIEGVLVRLEPTVVTSDNRQSETIEYMLVTDVRTGQRLTFLGTNDLNKKIHPGHIGHWLEIRYERDDNSFTKPGQSAAKIFKVEASAEKESGF